MIFAQKARESLDKKIDEYIVQKIKVINRLVLSNDSEGCLEFSVVKKCDYNLYNVWFPAVKKLVEILKKKRF